MIGQEKLINKINNTPLVSFPHSLILYGDVGSGKHTIAQHISNRFGYNIEDITEDISLELFNEISISPDVKFYIININEISIKDENVILKILEEPPTCAYFILLCTNKATVLPTVLNRCQIWELEKYSSDTLSSICNVPTNSFILKILSTPGQIISYRDYDSTLNIEKVYNYVDYAYNHMGNVHMANLFKLSQKLDFDNTQKEKCNFDICMRVIIYYLLNKVISGEDVNSSKVFNLTKSMYNSSYIPHIDKRNLFEKYLLNLNEMLSDRKSK